MAAAVEDITPAKQVSSKLKKSELPEALKLCVSPDLLRSFRAADRRCCIIGFSVEMEDGEVRSLEKMDAKGVDFIVWNDPSKTGVGFESDTNEVTIFAKDRTKWHLPMADKREIARQIINLIIEHRSKA
jgi:phosphopantothenoylcysteine decarboxylase/phosphopantothenate--cysteine ligase